MSKKAWLELAGLIGICFIAGALGVLIAVRLNTYVANKTSAEATKLVGTLHTGENVVSPCFNGEPYFVELFEAAPDQVGVLVGDIHAEIDLKTLPVSSDSPTQFTSGCLAIKVVKDPSSLYMLEVYAPPDKK